MKKCYLCDDENVVLQPAPNTIRITPVFNESETTVPAGSLLCNLCVRYIADCHAAGRVEEVT